MKILLLNQAFRPDTVSSGQHASDLAAALAMAGHGVTVITSRRAYDAPQKRFAPRETWRGVDIRRIASTGFGKTAKWRRAADFASFLAACAWRLLFTPGQDAVIGMTSPPLLSALAAAFVRIKGGVLISWVLDLNPDEAITAGWLDRKSATGRILEGLLRFSLETSSRVVVMDRFMAARVARRGIAPAKIDVLPPWPHDESIHYDAEGRTAFRREYNLEDKFVVMHSGNHSPCHPLDTLLESARRLSPENRFVFCFAGGGSELARVARFVREHNLRNILQLPYQPLEKLSAVLSSADLHVVVMGNPFVGIVHPCKVYNILSLGVPFVYIGPPESHIVDLTPDIPRASHGDSASLTEIIRTARATNGPGLPPQYTQSALVQRMVAVIEDR